MLSETLKQAEYGGGGEQEDEEGGGHGQGEGGGQFLKILGQNRITVPSGKCHTASQTFDCHFQTVSLALTHPSRSSYHNNGIRSTIHRNIQKNYKILNVLFV